ncbi:MAG: gfo/Idh/MocA family oxidoreductase [Candidatus Omnitrophota bacterium]|jgi:predicted dehydrogenase|nr:MAG: gfo/Idh/MocA family oxidoreductase [Candidatus Omnitrophota bacterium]
MKNESRRQFLQKSGYATIGLGLIGNARWAGANDAIRMAVVGLKGRGTDHIKGFAKQENVEIVAICDVDENIINLKADQLQDCLRQPVKKYVDIRELLSNPEIDAVSIATPNHWHSIMGIWACEAGKDVYVEKPCSHNIYEGRKLVEAARKYDRIVQHGTQGRSVNAFREAVQLLREGVIGDVYYAKGLCYKWRNTIGKKPEAATPEGVHYDLWIGPAPERPFTENRFHYNWHWQWYYGNGDIGNQGVHEMDIARWGLGVKLPRLTSAIGGHFMFDDDQETPNTLVSTFKYPDENKLLVFEVRHWITNDELDTDESGNVIGNLFFGSEGYMKTWGYGNYQVYLGQNRTPGPKGGSGENHYENFIQAVRSRKRDDLHAEIEEGHLSAALCHLANASYLTGRTLHFDPEKEECIGDEEANAILTGKSRRYRAPYRIEDGKRS